MKHPRQSEVFQSYFEDSTEIGNAGDKSSCVRPPTSGICKVAIGILEGSDRTGLVIDL